MNRPPYVLLNTICWGAEVCERPPVVSAVIVCPVHDGTGTVLCQTHALNLALSARLGALRRFVGASMHCPFCRNQVQVIVGGFL